MKWIKVIILFFFIVSLIPQNCLWAQKGQKIAYVNMAKVFDKYYKTQEADRKLETEGEKKNKERDRMIGKINKLRDEVALLSKEKRAKKGEKLNEEMRTLQDFDRDARLELQRKRDDMMREIFKEVSDTIKEYGKKQGYDLILDDRVLLYADDGIEITDALIKKLNK